MIYVGPWENRQRWKQEEETEQGRACRKGAIGEPSYLFAGGGLPLQATLIPQDVLKQLRTHPPPITHWQTV